jgi:SOS-response transcriptional repressor LexA
MNVKTIRRENMRALAKSVGGITKFAWRLDKLQSQISHLIGAFPTKNIGDKIAAQVEAAFNKSPGWLDKEHAYVEGTQIVYQIDQDQSAILCQQVPLITWQEAREWDRLAYNYKSCTEQMVAATIPVSAVAFALQVQGDSMEAPSGISFPDGVNIIAEPEQIAAPGSFVITTVSEGQQAILSQLVSDGNRRYLKSLNPRYPVFEFTSTTMIYGVVKQMFFDFKASTPLSR